MLPAPLLIESSNPPVTASRRVRAELALALGGFGIGTGEFVIMGLLPEVAAECRSTVTGAASAIGAYALGVVVGAPVIAVVAARCRRHALLGVLMAWFALGNLAAALATSLPWLVAARFATGLPHGAYFGVAALVAASLVPPDRRARAVGRVMLGLTGATLVGVPIATGLGQWLGWRSAFAFVGAIGAAACGLIALWVPRRPGDRAASPLRELAAFGRPQVLLTLGVGSVGLGGLFCVFTYIAPTMTAVAGVPAAWMPAVLAVFGMGMIAGNLIGSKLADRALMPTIAGALLWNVAAMGILPWTAPHPWLALANVLLIGHGVALVPALQVRLMDVAGDAQTLAASLNHSAFNVANALGAWLGGVAIDAGLGWTATGPVGAGLAVAGLIILGGSVAVAARGSRRAGAGRPTPAPATTSRPIAAWPSPWTVPRPVAACYPGAGGDSRRSPGI